MKRDNTVTRGVSWLIAICTLPAPLPPQLLECDLTTQRDACPFQLRLRAGTQDISALGDSNEGYKEGKVCDPLWPGPSRVPAKPSAPQTITSLAPGKGPSWASAWGRHPALPVFPVHLTFAPRVWLQSEAATSYLN